MAILTMAILTMAILTMAIRTTATPTMATGSLGSVRMSVWEALATLDGFVDLSDPDTSLPNSVHAFQAAPYLVVTLPIPGGIQAYW